MTARDSEPLDAFTRLLLLTDVQRERWVDHRLVGLTCAQIAARDGVGRNAVSRTVRNADIILAGHRQKAAA